MTMTVLGERAATDRGSSDAENDGTRGWYVYGITRRGSLAAVLTDAARAADGGGAVALRLLEHGELAAVARTVPLAEFSAAGLRERMQSASELEAMVRRHNDVIEAVHAHQAVLPAKFVSVYATADDVVSALRDAHDALVRRLARLEGCDEWAIHLYADRAAVREGVSADDPAIQRWREQCATSRPGRAYFLERRIRTELEKATERAMDQYAQAAYRRLSELSVAAQASPLEAATDASGEMEVLRAAFLVSRDRREEFGEAVRAAAESIEGTRSACTGPWPPYSFAVCDDEEIQ